MTNLMENLKEALKQDVRRVEHYIIYYKQLLKYFEILGAAPLEIEEAIHTLRRYNNHEFIMAVSDIEERIGQEEEDYEPTDTDKRVLVLVKSLLIMLSIPIALKDGEEAITVTDITLF